MIDITYMFIYLYYFSISESDNFRVEMERMWYKIDYFVYIDFEDYFSIYSDKSVSWRVFAWFGSGLSLEQSQEFYRRLHSMVTSSIWAGTYERCYLFGILRTRSNDNVSWILFAIKLWTLLQRLPFISFTPLPVSGKLVFSSR